MTKQAIFTIMHAVEEYVGLTGYPTYRLFDKQGGIHHLNWLDDENLPEFKKKLDALEELK
jgi:hypothetical protein